MKDFKKMIPSMASIPTPPSVATSTDSESSGATHSIPGAMPENVREIIEKIKGHAKGHFAMPDIDKLIKDFPIDQYRDAEGKITCPISQEMRDELKGFLK